MKRHIDLIREILLRIEDNKGLDGMQEYPPEEVTYNAALCVEAGLIEGEVILDGDGSIAGVSLLRLKWEGHEFLDAARNLDIYEEAKNGALKAGVSLSFDMARSYLRTISIQKLGI